MFAMNVARHDRSSPGAWPAVRRAPGFQGMKTRSLVIAFKMSLRRNLKTNVLFALAAFALLSAAGTTRALAGYPDRIIRIVVPFPPGGGTDVVARTLAQEMGQNLGVHVMIENKPGAG